MYGKFLLEYYLYSRLSFIIVESRNSIRLDGGFVFSKSLKESETDIKINCYIYL